MARYAKEQGQRRVVGYPDHQQPDEQRLAEERSGNFAGRSTGWPIAAAAGRAAWRSAGLACGGRTGERAGGDGGCLGGRRGSAVHVAARWGGGNPCAIPRRCARRDGRRGRPASARRNTPSPAAASPAKTSRPPVRMNKPVRQKHVLHHVRRANRPCSRRRRESAAEPIIFNSAAGIEPARGFVEEKHRRTAQQFHADAHALALPAGEGLHARVGLRGESEALDRLAPQACAVRSSGVPAGSRSRALKNSAWQ